MDQIGHKMDQKAKNSLFVQLSVCRDFVCGACAFGGNNSEWSQPGRKLWAYFSSTVIIYHQTAIKLCKSCDQAFVVLSSSCHQASANKMSPSCPVPRGSRVKIFIRVRWFKCTTNASHCQTKVWWELKKDCMCLKSRPEKTLLLLNHIDQLASAPRDF